MDSTIDWRNGARLATAVNVTKEGGLEPFEISPGVVVPIDTYAHTEGQVRFNTNRGAPLSFEIRGARTPGWWSERQCGPRRPREFG